MAGPGRPRKNPGIEFGKRESVPFDPEKSYAKGQRGQRPFYIQNGRFYNIDHSELTEEELAKE